MDRNSLCELGWAFLPVLSHGSHQFISLDGSKMILCPGFPEYQGPYYILLIGYLNHYHPRKPSLPTQFLTNSRRFRIFERFYSDGSHLAKCPDLAIYFIHSQSSVNTWVLFTFRVSWIVYTTPAVE